MRRSLAIEADMPEQSGLAVGRTLLEAAVWGPVRAAARSDFDLNPDARDDLDPARRLRPAAVLCPLRPRGEGDGFDVILTRRADHLARHAGQVAFPGGKIDPTDPSPLAAALREAEEEIGLAPAQVEVLGAIDPYETVTGFLVTPFVGVVSRAFQPILDEQEVAEVFETPLDFLMDRANLRRGRYQKAGRTRRYYVYEREGRVIWGATAGMLKSLSDRVETARETAAESA